MGAPRRTADGRANGTPVPIPRGSRLTRAPHDTLVHVLRNLDYLSRLSVLRCYTRPQVTSTSAKPRLAGRQPPRHGGVLREMTWPPRAVVVRDDRGPRRQA